jgi:hypothetical protein
MQHTGAEAMHRTWKELQIHVLESLTPEEIVDALSEEELEQVQRLIDARRNAEKPKVIEQDSTE